MRLLMVVLLLASCGYQPVKVNYEGHLVGEDDPCSCAKYLGNELQDVITKQVYFQCYYVNAEACPRTTPDGRPLVCLGGGPCSWQAPVQGVRGGEL